MLTGGGSDTITRLSPWNPSDNSNLICSSVATGYSQYGLNLSFSECDYATDGKSGWTPSINNDGTTSEWIGFDALYNRKLTTASFKVNYNGSRTLTMTYKLQGSSDQSTWVDLSVPYSEQYNVTWSNNIWYYYELENTKSVNTKYKYFRITFTGNVSFSVSRQIGICVKEMQFFGY